MSSAGRSLYRQLLCGYMRRRGKGKVVGVGSGTSSSRIGVRHSALACSQRRVVVARHSLLCRWCSSVLLSSQRIVSRRSCWFPPTNCCLVTDAAGSGSINLRCVVKQRSGPACSTQVRRRRWTMPCPADSIFNANQSLCYAAAA